MIIDIVGRLQAGRTKVPPLWQNSKHELWWKNNNYTKGAHGTECYRQFLEHRGLEAQVISDEGDIRYRKNSQSPWIKAEVKASKADLKALSCGFVNESLWFNQLRPQQKGWDEAVLVGIYPNHIRIWRKTRSEWDLTCDKMESTQKVLEHVGTDQLRGVQLIKNSKRNNFYEWEIIHNDQQGELL
jgi:hypothetical protein